ncbi:MAG: hotdog fold thioesterase, partial [Alphaproteobacteria bacterium]
MPGEAPPRETPDAYAARSVEALRRGDRVARDLDIALEEIGMGRCRVAMTVRAEMANGYGICHGGYIFTLADTAMAYACNGRNRTTLAQHAQISFVSPGRVGERLAATARELSRAGRNGLYDVEVRAEDG